MEDSIKLALVAEVKRLLLTHHDPSHTDTQLNEVYSGLLRNNGKLLSFDMAREGMEIELG
jgi:phosphoribosyl 1,2-cyclic phosphodiesterase